MARIESLLVAWETPYVTIDVVNRMVEDLVSIKDLYLPPVFDAFFSPANCHPTRIGFVTALNIRPMRDTEKLGMFADVDIQDIHIADQLLSGDLVVRAAVQLDDGHEHLDYVAIVPSCEAMCP